MWILPRAINVYGGTTICIDNAHLRQADESADNIFKTAYTLTEEGKKLKNRLFDIHIYGVGNAVLDGGNHNGITELNHPEGGPYAISGSPIHFTNAERLVVENLRIVNQRYWGMCFQFCSSGRVSNIHFMSNGLVPNQDGIDLRSGCNSFIIENICL
jgi:polygalacturonase